MEIFDQVFGAIADNANRGASATGDIADNLIRAGLSIAAITQLLNGVATSAAATPAIVNYTQDELRYLQSAAYTQPRTNWTPFLILGAIIYFASRE